MSDSDPKIDKRNFDSIVKEIENLIPYYLPNWRPADSKDDFGISLSKVYAKLLQFVLSKLKSQSFLHFNSIIILERFQGP